MFGKKSDVEEKSKKPKGPTKEERGKKRSYLERLLSNF